MHWRAGQAKEANLLFVLSGDHYAKRHIQDLVVPSMGRKFLDVGSNGTRFRCFRCFRIGTGLSTETSSFHQVERASAFKLGAPVFPQGLQTSPTHHIITRW